MKLPKPRISSVEPTIEDNISSTNLLSPNIFFGSTENSYYQTLNDVEDFNTCPSFSEVVSRYSRLHRQEEFSIISKKLQKAIYNASYRIWILDSYLGNTLEIDNNNKIKLLFDLIVANPSKLNVRCYFRKNLKEGQLEKLNGLMKESNEHIRRHTKNPKATIIEYKLFNNIKFLHDRFAIIDDDLWHFGSDFGSSQPSLHATSNGWDANELKMTNFFEKLWQEGR